MPVHREGGAAVEAGGRQADAVAQCDAGRLVVLRHARDSHAYVSRRRDRRNGGQGGAARRGSDYCLRPVYDGHVEQQQISCLEMRADAHLSRPGESRGASNTGGGVQGVAHVYARVCLIHAACVHVARLVQVAGERIRRVAAVSVADVRHTLALIAPVQGKGQDASQSQAGGRASML